MYQALYRKWRPKTFSDVIGQAHITETLARQVADGRTSHAYLFTGTRGTGKTSCAKILAKAVNCENPQNGNPCNECAACRGIENGSFLDVLELDAASNNGVDQVRALRDEAVYTPAQVKFRVYIIDEVHMLSTPAFNALLKILEEPPEHLRFILATTELHRVPATILSRCQRFSFKRITPQDIAARLRYVAQQEGIPLTPDGAELLSRLADGALRDALSLLDQCASGGETLDSTFILQVLGLAGNLRTAQLMDCVLRRDAKAALLLLNELYAGGKDAGTVLSELSALTRDLLLRKSAPEGGAALLTGGYDRETLDKLSQNCSATRLIFLATTLQERSSALRESTNRRTDAELCLLRLCDETLSGDLVALAARMERLEQQLARRVALAPEEVPAPLSFDEISPAPAQTAPLPVCALPEPTAQTTPPWEEAPPAEEADFDLSYGDEDAPPLAHSTPLLEEELPAEGEEAAPPQKSKSAKSADAGFWRQLAEDCKGRLPPMRRVFLDKASGTLEGAVLTVCCSDELTKDKLNADSVRSVLKELGEKAAGQPISVHFTVGKPAAADEGDRLENLIQFGSQFDSFTVK